MIPQVDRIEDHSFLASGLHSGSVVVDLGMCYGDFATGIAERYGCRIVGAEPVPEFFGKLPALKRLSAYPLALSGREGIVTLYLNASGCPTTSPGLVEDSGASVEVPALTLDSFLAEAGVTHVDLLKVDIEGAEIPMLLSTSEATLQKIRQRTVEFHEFIDPAQGPAVQAVDRRLRAAGFRRIRFSRDNTDVLYLSKARGGPGRIGMLPALIWGRYRLGLRRVWRRWKGTSRTGAHTAP